MRSVYIDRPASHRTTVDHPWRTRLLPELGRQAAALT